MSSDEDDVEIVHLQEGTVRIVLPPAGFEYRHDGGNIDQPSSLVSPWPASSSQISVMEPARTLSQQSPHPGKETERKSVTHPIDYTSQNLVSSRKKSTSGKGYAQSDTETEDRFYYIQDQTPILTSAEQEEQGNNQNKNVRSGIKRKSVEGQQTEDLVKKHYYSDECGVPGEGVPSFASRYASKTTSGDEMETSKRQDHTIYHTFTGQIPTLTPSSLTSDTNTISCSTRPVDEKSPSTPFPSSNPVNRPSGAAATVAKLFEQRGIMSDRQQSEQSSPFVTTLSSGVTRIVVQQSLLQQEPDVKDLHTMDSERTAMSGDTGHTIDSGDVWSDDDNKSLVFSNLTFDCLEDVQVSSENEEQLAHLLLTADTSETDSDSQQHSALYTEMTRDSSREETNQNDDFDRSSHGASDQGQGRLHSSGRFPKDHHPSFTGSTVGREWFVLSPLGETRSRGTRKWIGVKTSPPQSKDTRKPGGVHLEDTSDSEGVFTGHTYSRAMWRSMSAEAGHLDPSFSSRTPLHTAFSTLQHEQSGSTSSDEERVKPSANRSFFRRHWPEKISRKWTQNKYIPREAWHDKSYSKDMEDRGMQMRMTDESDTDHKSERRYLEAALALAESKRTKSKVFPGKPQIKDMKIETSSRQPHIQKKKITTMEDSRKSSSVPMSTAYQGSFSGLFHTEINRTDKILPSKADSRDRQERSSHVLNVTSLPAESSHSSSELTSSDSPRSASLTPIEKDESESTSSSSANSVHTIYFVPEKSARGDAFSEGSVSKRSPIRLKGSYYTVQKSSGDLHSSSGPEASEREGKSIKKKKPRLAPSQQQSLAARDIVKARAKQTAGKGVGLEIPTEADMLQHGVKDMPSSNLANFQTEKHDNLNSQFVSDPKSRRTFKMDRSKTQPMASSLHGSSETLTGGGSFRNSDSGHKIPMSRSSSDVLLTSESEVGPLVSFPRTRKTTWGGVSSLSSGAGESEVGQETELDNVTAVELMRRYSTEEYVPASPYAGFLKRHPSNLSDGARPLFLQRPRSRSRSGFVRQVSLDIGEEWESVHSPQATSPPAEDDNLFFGPSTSFDRRTSALQEHIPLQKVISDDTPKPSSLRKKSHQTSAKLRLLYPNPADPRCLSMSEKEQRELLSTLTRAELARLQHAGSPLLGLLEGPKKDGADKVKRSEKERKEDSPPPAPPPASPVERSQAAAAPPLVETDPRSQKPTVTVQPMRQVPHKYGSGPEGEGRSGDVIMAIPPDPSNVLQSGGVGALPSSQRRLLPNPFNRLNQRCHSTLQCPCCFFFCFLCCAPAVVFMKRSDFEFDYGSLNKARNFGRRTTVLYVIGAMAAVCLWVTSIVTTVLLLQEPLLRRRGWS